MNFNNDQPTAAQMKRRGTRTKPVGTWSTPAAGPSVGKWTEPPGKPGGWVRAEWRKHEELAARVADARKRQAAEQRLALAVAAARVARKRDKAKAATVRRLLAAPSPRRRPAVGRTATDTTAPSSTAPLYRTRSCPSSFTVR
jgi:hypothetical protein